MFIPATQLRNGAVIKYQNDLYRVTDVMHVTPGNWRGMVQTKADAELLEDVEHGLDVPNPRDVAQDDLFVGQDRGGEDRERAVLVPGGGHSTAEGRAPLDHEALHQRVADQNGRHERSIVVGGMEVTRERAWDTLTRYTKSEALLRHALAVEAAVRAYARTLDGDEELWGATALLHDFDYEIHPTLDKHPQDGAPILREEGYPEDVIEAVLSHAEHLALPRDTPPPLAEPDAAEEEDEKDRDGSFYGEREPLRMVRDQPRESTHRPPTVYSTISPSIGYWERRASARS